MLDADGAAAMEDLRAELARAKEQARKSDAAALKAAEELKAEQTAHCRSREEMAEMAVKLKNATNRYEFLEKERRAEQEDLKKATAEAKDARSAMQAIKEELRQARDIALESPFCCGGSLRIRSMLSWASCGCGGCLSEFGSECRRHGRTLPGPKGSRNGRAFLVAIP